MTCTRVGAAIVCSGPRGVYRRRVRECPTEGRRTRMVETWGGAWYGSTLRCCSCGDGWGDGERLPRPFERAWRTRETATARQKWAAALPPRAYLARIRADVRSALR